MSLMPIEIYGQCMGSGLSQLTVRSLPIPEDPGSNPFIGKWYCTYLLLTICRKDENEEKEAGKGTF